MWRQISWCWVCAHLVALAAEDGKTGYLSMYVVGSLGVSGMAAACLRGDLPVLLPGALLLAAGYLSEERIGYGDGCLALALGFWMDYPDLIFLLGAGIFSAVCAAAVSGKKEMPLAPFVAAVYLWRGWN